MTDATVRQVEETPAAASGTVVPEAGASDAAEAEASAPDTAPPDATAPDLRAAPHEVAAQHGLRSTSDRPPFAEYGRQLWAYRHFITTFAGAKHVASLSGARLGQFWHVLTPLVNAAVYFLVFGMLLDTSRGIVNFIGFLCVGIFLFTFTQTTVMSGVRSISENLGLIRALKFPRASLPIAATLIQVRQLVYSIIVLLAIIVVTGESLAFRWLLLVPVLVLQAVFNTGLALVMARLGSRATDLKQLVPFAVRAWMYGSGVFYSVSRFADDLPPVVSELLQLNPLLVYIELARIALLESPAAGSSLLQHLLVGTGWAIVTGIAGYVYFWRGEQEYGRG